MLRWMIGATVLSCSLVPIVASAAGPSSLDYEQIKDCWIRTSPDDRAGLTIKHDDQGRPVWVMWTDDATGEEVFGLVPSFRICFRDSGEVSFSAIGGDEGLEASGRYSLRGKRVEFMIEELFDAWAFSNLRTVCDLSVEGEVLALTSCQDADDGTLDTLASDQRYARTVENVSH